MNFWSNEKKSDHLYLVTEGYSMVHRFTLGVVVGEEKVLVIDAGLGMDKGLRAYVEGIVGTEKPIICACTHGHPDHVGSACLFDEAYLNSRDYEKLTSFALDTDTRFRDLADFALDSPEVLTYCKEHYLDNRHTVFRDFDDGFVFDLGGVKIEAVSLPGHSPGHHVFLNREEGYVFTGDAVNMDVRITKLERAGLFSYRDALERFLFIVGQDAVLYPAHLPVALSPDVARHLARACEEIAAGKTTDDPPGETIFKERKGNASIRMHEVNNVCIIYDRSLCDPLWSQEIQAEGVGNR